MTIDDIRSYPTCFCGAPITDEFKKERAAGNPPVIYGEAHESLLRYYHITQKVKELLYMKTPPSVILEMIKLMEAP